MTTQEREELIRFTGVFIYKLNRLTKAQQAAIRKNTGCRFKEARDCCWFFELLDTYANSETITDICFMVATLFCSNKGDESNSKTTDDFGNTVQELYLRRKSNASIERRFGGLLDAESLESKEIALRSLVRLAKTESLAINWKVLLEDLLLWDKAVRIKWAKSFWVYTK